MDSCCSLDLLEKLLNEFVDTLWSLESRVSSWTLDFRVELKPNEKKQKASGMRLIKKSRIEYGISVAKL